MTLTKRRAVDFCRVTTAICCRQVLPIPTAQAET
ncbi:MAG: putative leader peptide [Streptosporangiaceae bacterium]